MRNKIKIGVIPAAGSGNRFGYLSKFLPKTMLPLYDRPILHYVIDQMGKCGISDVYIVVNQFKELITKYLKVVEKDFKINLHIIEQKKLNGTAGAILLAKKYTKADPFIVIYGDDCTITNDLSNMMDDFIKNGSIVTEGVVKENNINVLKQTCSVKQASNGKIIEILEKPKNPPYMLRGCGIYLFQSDIYGFIKKTPYHFARKEKEITYTINMLAGLGKANGYLLNGFNININDYEQLLQASILCKTLKNQNFKQTSPL